MAASFLYSPALACVSPPMYEKSAPTVAITAVATASRPAMLCGSACAACSSSWSCGPWTWKPPADIQSPWVDVVVDLEVDMDVDVEVDSGITVSVTLGLRV